MAKLDLQAGKKDNEIESIFKELKSFVEETEIEQRVDRISRVIARRSSLLGKSYRKNVPLNKLKKIVEQKVKEENNKSTPGSEITGKINQVWDLVSKKYDLLKEGDKKIENLLKEVEHVLKKVGKRSAGRRSSSSEEDRTVMTNNIAELNVLLKQQKDLLEGHKDEIDGAMNELGVKILKRDDSSLVNEKTEKFKEEIMEKDAILKDKYSHLENSVSQLEETRKEAEKARIRLEEAENTPFVPKDLMVSLDDAEHFAENQFLHDEEETSNVDDQLNRIEVLKAQVATKDKKITALENTQKEWLNIAHK